MNNLTKTLHELAVEKSGPEIKPCGFNKSFDDCISRMGDRLYLWYNDNSGSTLTVFIQTKKESE